MSQSYALYLQSSHWLKLREQKFKECGRNCSLCGCDQRIQVHHINYRYPWASCTTKDLQVMCEWCHAKHHRVGLPSERKPEEFRSKSTKPWKAKKPLSAKEQKQFLKYSRAWASVRSGRTCR